MLKPLSRTLWVEKIAVLFHRLFGPSGGSAECARNRLKVLILCDRIALGRVDLEALRSDMTAVVSRYIDVDPVQVELEVKRRGDKTVLLTVFPLRSAGGGAR